MNISDDLIKYLGRSIGVSGAALISPQGEILAKRLPETFEEAAIPVIFERGKAAIEATRAKLDNAYEIRLDTHQLTFFLRDLGEDFLLVVAFDSGQASSAKVAIDVVARRYRKEKGISRSGK